MIGNKETSGLIQDVLNTFQDAVVWIDTNSRIVEWNTAAERLFGFSRSEVLSHTLVNTIVPDEHRAAHLNGMAKYMETGTGAIFGRTVNINAMTWSGNLIDIAISIDSIKVAGQQYFTAHIRKLDKQTIDTPEITPIADVVAESGMGVTLALEPKET